MNLRFTHDSSTLTPANRTTRGWLRGQPTGELILQPVSKSKDRTAEQNRMLWMWNTEVSMFLGDMTREEVHWYCKLYFGIPILRRDNVAFEDVWQRCFHQLPVETQQEAMSFVDVTSRFNVKQASEYMDAVLRHWSQQGCVLTVPEDR